MITLYVAVERVPGMRKVGTSVTGRVKGRTYAVDVWSLACSINRIVHNIVSLVSG